MSSGCLRSNFEVRRLMSFAALGLTVLVIGCKGPPPKMADFPNDPLANDFPDLNNYHRIVAARGTEPAAVMKGGS